MTHLSGLTRENEVLLSGAYSVKGLKRRWGPLAEACVSFSGGDVGNIFFNWAWAIKDIY